MKHIYYDNIIPPNYYNDLLDLSKYIAQKLDIYISMRDLYNFWKRVSDLYDSVWLPVEYTVSGIAREDFLMHYLEAYCFDPKEWRE